MPTIVKHVNHRCRHTELKHLKVKKALCKSKYEGMPSRGKRKARVDAKQKGMQSRRDMKSRRGT